jgi:uncharacterized protein (DUF3084 family)
MANGTGKWLGIIIAIVGLLIGSVGSVVGIAWAGGGRLTSVEKDVEYHGRYIEADKEYSLRVDNELKALRVEQSEAKMRDSRMEGQYKAIETYMGTTSAQTQKLVENFGEYLKAQHQLELKVEGVKKTVENLQKVD